MIFFDTSCIAKCYLHETESGVVLDFVEAHPGILISELTTVELLSAVRRSVWADQKSRKGIRLIMRRFEQHCQNRIWRTLPITSSIFDEAYQCMLRLAPNVPLRTLDALQLTCARVAEVDTLYTYDQRMLAVARRFGVSAKTL